MDRVMLFLFTYLKAECCIMKNIVINNSWINDLAIHSKKIAFIELNDGSYFKSTQIVLEENLENYNTALFYNKTDIPVKFTVNFMI